MRGTARRRPLRPVTEESPTETLIDAIQELARVPKLAEIETLVTSAARRMTRAAGATLIMLEDDTADYVAEDSLAPLLKDRQRAARRRPRRLGDPRPRAQVVIADVLADQRVDRETYAQTFVKSVAIVPIRAHDPIGAVGVYWSIRHQASETELSLLHSLADATSVALENLRLERLLRVDELTGLTTGAGSSSAPTPALTRPPSATASARQR